MGSMSAELSKALCKVQAGSLVQRLERGVAARSTQTGKQSLMVLLAILQALLERTMSEDLLVMSLYRARDLCPAVPEDEFDLVSEAILREFKRKKSPVKDMF